MDLDSRDLLYCCTWDLWVFDLGIFYLVENRGMWRRQYF